LLDRRTECLLRIRDVRARTGLSVATVYRREAQGTFPTRVKLGVRMVAWYASDIDAWVANPMGWKVMEASLTHV
jgi:prophage regulatory protein